MPPSRCADVWLNFTLEYKDSTKPQRRTKKEDQMASSPRPYEMSPICITNSRSAACAPTDASVSCAALDVPCGAADGVNVDREWGEWSERVKGKGRQEQVQAQEQEQEQEFELLAWLPGEH